MDELLCGFKRLVYVISGEGQDCWGVGEEYVASLASLNKVLLGYLRRSESRGPFRAREERRFRVFLEALAGVSEALEGLDHVFIKLRRPVEYVPADIDVLVGPGDVAEASLRLRGLGYRPVERDPYTLTMERGPIVVDLYTHPALGGMVYMDPGPLWGAVEDARVHGLRLRALKPYAEALLAATHATIKEAIYTLNDHLTVTLWADRRTLELAVETRNQEALRLALGVSRLVSEGAIALPWKMGAPQWIALLARKTAGDSLARATSPNLLKALLGRRAGRLVASRALRSSY